MKYSFLRFSISKIIDLNLDVKDIILRYLVDFNDTRKMNIEAIYGETYY